MSHESVGDTTLAIIKDAAVRRDVLAEQRDRDADARDVTAEQEVVIWGVDYSIHDARPFHARQLAKKDRQAAAADRIAAAADRLLYHAALDEAGAATTHPTAHE